MLLIENIGLLLTPQGTTSLCGAAQDDLMRVKNASVLVSDGGSIVSVAGAGAHPDGWESAEVIDAGGRLMTPGLVDCHTHLVFGGWREHELAQKLAGASYLDILNAGGGILNTLTHTRRLSEDALFARSMGFLDEMLLLGVTTAEIKSGYGLNYYDELKQLRVIRRLGQAHAMDVVPTFLGAHAVPPEFSGDADGYIRFLCDAVLPAVARDRLAEYCDVFCEASVFDAAQARRLLIKAQSLGLGLKIHADEIAPIGGSALAGELSAVSAEHLIVIPESGMDSMAAAGVTAVLLPQTSLYLDKPFAPARRMIEKGIPVAVASDFNPGSCPSLNLQLSINLACLKYGMTPDEVLSAVTLNAACAIGRGETLGSVEPGKQADLVLWDAEDMDMLCYRMGTNQVHAVIKKGRKL